MKPQTILVNVIIAIVLSAGVLMLIDAGDAPPASEQATTAQQDSTQRDSTGGASPASISIRTPALRTMAMMTLTRMV